MKRLALLVLLVPVLVAACGGSSGDSGLAPAPTPPASEPPADAAPAPTPAEPAPGEPAAPAAEGEEIGEQRGLGDVGGEEMPADQPAEPPAEAAPAEAPAEAPAREEDTSRPLAPVITGTDLDGEPLSIEDFKGTPVVVKVYAEH